MPWKMASRPSLVEMQTSLHMVRSSCSDLIIASRVVWREIHGYWIQLVLISVKDRLSNVISRVLTSQRTEGGETGRESERERERERERLPFHAILLVVIPQKCNSVSSRSPF
jgi:hypothetical protein